MPRKLVPLLALLALTAVAATNAAASPAWYECAKVKAHESGGFSDPDCTTASEHGAYQLRPGVGKAKRFKLSGGPAAWVTVVPPETLSVLPGGGEVDVKCTSVSGHGRPEPPNAVRSVVLQFKGCKAFGAPCSSGGKKYTIETTDLTGELVDIERGSGVGIDLHSNSRIPVATIACAEVDFARVDGSVIAELTGDIGSITTESAYHFVTGPGLGEVEFKPGRWYSPKVNEPTHATGGEGDEALLGFEMTSWRLGDPLITLPGDVEGTFTSRGEPLLVMP